MKIHPRLIVIIALTAGPVSCRSTAVDQAPIIQPGGPGQASRVLAPGATADLVRPARSAADVKFMQGMIGHHAQAIEMTTLLATRTVSDAMRKLAQRIEVSQTDEIRMMRDWLAGRGAGLPDEHA